MVFLSLIVNRKVDILVYMTSLCRHDDKPYCGYCIYCELDGLGIKEDQLEKAQMYLYSVHKKSYGGGGCDKCKGIDEPYMLKDWVWKQVNKKYKGFLCLSCVENKLVRYLTLNDFKEVPINFGGLNSFDVRSWLKFGHL